MASIILRLNISSLQFQRLYQGVANEVNAVSVDGRKVRFPAAILRPYITHGGVVGTFAIHFSPDNRYERIEKID